MPDIKLECFDLARNVDIHTYTVSDTQERAVEGVTTGLLELGDVVTWEAVHFGIHQRLTVKITEFERPHRFVVDLVRGAFKTHKHIFEFKCVNDRTLMIDTFQYTSPLGVLGRLADKLFLEKYLRNFLLTKNENLKKIAELDA